MLKIFNSLSRKIEEFTPINPPKVGMYTCGPTVYGYLHIGNLRKYVIDDIFVKVLIANGFEVKHVMNITDVGHLVSDEDQGEDKMEKGARETGRTVWEVAKFYEEHFWKSARLLNLNPPDITCRATEHIGAQIKLIEKLEKNGFIYVTDQAVYFDVSKFPDYTKLSGQKLEDKEIGSRIDVVVDKQKKHPQDFALWFFTVGHFKDHTMRWNSPWGEGFPGWHIECSAMSMEYLGETLDIHTGGVDHISVHHTNEIAQSEGATGKQFVHYWVHYEFLMVDGGKISKSLKNGFKIEEIIERGFDPLALKYLYLTAHYRDKLNFTWKSLQACQNALNNLREEIRNWPSNPLESNSVTLSETKGIYPSTSPRHDVASSQDDNFYEQFLEALNNDLNTPQALAVLWKMVKDQDYPVEQKSRELLEMNKILGLKLAEFLGKKVKIPEEIKKLLVEREQARVNKDFTKSDQIRKQIQELGYEVEDTPDGSRIKKS